MNNNDIKISNEFQKIDETQQKFLSGNNSQVPNELCLGKNMYGINSHNYSEIIPNKLYLGNKTIVEDKELIDKCEINSIVNLTENLYNYPDNLTIYHCKIEDTLDQGIKWIEDAAKFIDLQLNSKKKVYVHCVMGISRSPTLIIYYLMTRTMTKQIDAFDKMNLKQSYEYVLSKRKIICPNIGFMKCLMQIEKTLSHVDESLTEKEYVISQTHALFPSLERSNIDEMYNFVIELPPNKLVSKNVHKVGYTLFDILVKKYPGVLKKRYGTSYHHPFD